MTDRIAADQARTRRRELKEAKACINGRTHGPPVDGGLRCDWCREVHRRGVEVVAADPLWRDRRPVKPHAKLRGLPVSDVLATCGNNMTNAAKILGVTRQAVALHVKRRAARDRRNLTVATVAS